jgi:hypothetical protein
VGRALHVNMKQTIEHCRGVLLPGSRRSKVQSLAHKPEVNVRHSTSKESEQVYPLHKNFNAMNDNRERQPKFEVCMLSFVC